ncbi:MAG TPA: hypothetical protein VGM39_10925 [Kofleriaceae bacterium]|jgi:hypothetical protein
MRTTIVSASLFAAALLVGACSNSKDPGQSGDDTSSGDDGTGDDGSDNPPPPTRGFQLVSPDVTIQPGPAGEDTYCWYFHTPNTEDMVIKKWSSSMTEGSHHMILFLTTNDEKAPGTIDDQGCGSFSGTNLPAWTYAAQSATNELELPQDDGAGKPLGQLIKAGSSGYIQMHYLNTTDDAVQAHVTLNAEAYEAGTAYTNTAPFITYQTDISVGPNAMGVTVTKNAPVSADKKFWLMSTHAHKQAVDTQVKDGANMLFDSNDWEHPGTKEWDANPFYSFSSGSLTWSCTYNNTGDNHNRTVTQGGSAATDEMCMATAYYFPATKAITCVSASGPNAFCL